MGTTRFEDCLAFVLEREGGLVNNPHDRGGATNKGITQRTYDEWRERKGYEQRSVAQIEQVEVMAIYNEQYWTPVRGIKLPDPIDLIMFDSAVQHGAVRPVKWLQEIVGADVDGRFGGNTLAAMNTYISANGLDKLVDALMARRAKFYDQIIANDPAQKVFAKGWGNRMLALRGETMA